MTTTDTTTAKHIYRLSDTQAGSAKYGPCEICGKHCDSVYLQRKEKISTYGFPIHAGSAFGHKSCLEGIRQ